MKVASNVIVKAAGVDDFGQLRGQVRIVKLDRQFEIQAKASHVPIRASDEAPAAVNRHQFRMIEWRRTSPHMTPCLQQGPNMRLGGLGVSSRTLMAHSYRVIRRMRYGTDSTRERHNDRAAVFRVKRLEGATACDP